MKLNGFHSYIWIMIGVVVLGIILVAYLVNLTVLLQLIQAIEWRYMAGATAFLLMGYGLMTARWRFLLLNQPGWMATFRANSIGYMLNVIFFVPTLVSRVVITGWTTAVSTPRASSSIVIERLLEQVMRLLAVIAVVILSAVDLSDASLFMRRSLIMLIVVFGVIAWAVRHREKIADSLVPYLSRLPFLNKTQVRDTTLEAMQSLGEVKAIGHLVTGLFLSLAMWSCFFVFQYLVLAALPLELSTKQMVTMAMVVLAVAPPSILVTSGVYHVIVVVALLTLQLTDTVTAIAYAIILHVPQMICWLGLGGWAWRQTNLSFQKLSQTIRAYGSTFNDDNREEEQ